MCVYGGGWPEIFDQIFKSMFCYLNGKYMNKLGLLTLSLLGIELRQSSDPGFRHDDDYVLVTLFRLINQHVARCMSFE